MNKNYKIAGVFFIVAAFLLAYSPVALLIAKNWSNFGDRYGHGWLVFFVFIFMVRKVDKETVIQAGGTSKSLVWWTLLLGFGLVVFAAYIMNVQAIMMNLLPVLLWFNFAALFGVAYAKKMLLPCLFLYSGLPIWNYINTTLQSMTSFVVGDWLQWLGFTAYIHENTIIIPSGIFEIAGGCSGFKYFISSVAISLLYGFLYADTVVKKVSVFLIAVLLAIIANWIRVAIVVYVGYESQMEHPWVKDHDNMGWVVYGFSLIPFFWLASKITANFTNIENVETPPTRSIVEIWKHQGRGRLVTTLAVVCLPCALFSIMKIMWLEKAVEEKYTVKDWRVWESVNNAWRPELFNETTYDAESYYDPDSHYSFDVHYATFLGLSGQSDPFYYLNTLVPNQWTLIKSTEVVLVDDVLIDELIVENEEQEKVLIHAWYEAGDYVGVNRLKLKLNIFKSFFEGRFGQRLIAFSQQCESENCEYVAGQNLQFAHNWFTLNHMDTISQGE